MREADFTGAWGVPNKQSEPPVAVIGISKKDIAIDCLPDEKKTMETEFYQNYCILTVGFI